MKEECKKHGCKNYVGNSWVNEKGELESVFLCCLNDECKYEAHTRKYSNALLHGGYREWLPVEDALAAVELAKDELINDAIEGEIIGYTNGLSSTVKYHSFALEEVAHFPIIGEIGEKVKIIIIKE